MPNETMEGIVVAVLRAKGFCFIRGQDGLTRFAHVRNFVSQTAFDLLYDGQQVTFIPMDLNSTGEQIRGNGLRAVQVEVVKRG